MSYFISSRRDGNELKLLTIAKKLGITWVQGPPLDGWAGFQSQWTPVEIKLPKRSGHADEFGERQQKFMQLCDANRLPYCIWRSAADVMNFANAITIGG